MGRLMKQGPEVQHLDIALRLSTLVAGGFMGDDPRSVTEVIDTDAGELSRLGVTAGDIAARMKEITEKAAAASGHLDGGGPRPRGAGR